MVEARTLLTFLTALVLVLKAYPCLRRPEAEPLAEISGSEAVERMRRMPRFSTGSGGIDRLLGGGLVGGRLVEAFGPSGSGKTQLAMQAAMVAAMTGSGAAFLDSEGSFRPERVEGIAEARGWDSDLILKRISYSRVDTSAEQMEAVRSLPKSAGGAPVRLVVVDTLTRNFTLDFPGGENAAERQGALDVHLSEMARDAFLSSRAYLLTNRVTYSEETGETHVGGATVGQMVGASVSLSRSGPEIRARLVGAAMSELCRLGPSGLV